MLEESVTTDPKAVCIAVRPHVSEIVRIGIEASPGGIWLGRELRDEGLPVTVDEARYMCSAMGALRNQTDRNDAHGIAQPMRMGWFRAVHVKPVETQRRKTFLSRRLRKRKLVDLQNHLRGALRVHVLKVGPIAAGQFDSRIREFIEGNGDYIVRGRDIGIGGSKYPARLLVRSIAAELGVDENSMRYRLARLRIAAPDGRRDKAEVRAPYGTIIARWMACQAEVLGRPENT